MSHKAFAEVPCEFSDPFPNRLICLGADFQQSSYILRIRIKEALCIPFGRFKGGKLIAVEPGSYSYVGSALAHSGPTCLARRLIRHATRTGDRTPQPIRATMLEDFARVGLGSGDLVPRDGKRLKWNVDHLLDQPTVTLEGIFAIRSPDRLEGELGKLLENDPATIVFERGLGANDIPGNTHLLRVEADEEWWQKLPSKVRKLMKTMSPRRTARLANGH